MWITIAAYFLKITDILKLFSLHWCSETGKKMLTHVQYLLFFPNIDMLAFATFVFPVISPNVLIALGKLTRRFRNRHSSSFQTAPRVPMSKMIWKRQRVTTDTWSTAISMSLISVPWKKACFLATNCHPRYYSNYYSIIINNTSNTRMKQWFPRVGKVAWNTGDRVELFLRIDNDLKRAIDLLYGEPVPSSKLHFFSSCFFSLLPSTNLDLCSSLGPFLCGYSLPHTQHVPFISNSIVEHFY